ncbi:hypothetical protein BH11PSE4_BH11PSE4_25400 [soil metagenome]
MFRHVLFGLVLALFAAASGAWPRAAQAAGQDVPPFCIKRGGVFGPDTMRQLCYWYDYQTCLQAAAELNGNCVVNIDYKGVVSTAPVAPRARRVR